MRDPLSLGALTGADFKSADANVSPEFKQSSFMVREISFQSFPSNRSSVYVGYSDMDLATGFEVLAILQPGETFLLVKPSVDRLINLSDYGVLLEDPSEKVLVTARID